MLGQDRISRYISGYPAEEVSAEINIPFMAMSSSEISFTQTQYPYISITEFTGGPRAIIRGTRIPVSVVIRYLLQGETPQTLTKGILPHVTLTQIHNAVLYYATHRLQIDKELREETEEAGQNTLRQSLDNAKYKAVTGHEHK